MIRLIKNTIKHALPAPMWEQFRARWWRYARPLTVDYCPITLPWFPGYRGKDCTAQLHRLATSFHWRDQRSFITSACVAVAAMAWPFRFVGDSMHAIRRYGRGVGELYHIGRWRQFSEIVQYGLRSNIPPLYYYRYRLFDRANGCRASSYIHAEEMSILHPTLVVDLPSDAPLRRKESFFEHAQQYGVAVVEAIAVFADGELRRWYGATPGELPSCDLILKPVDEACGRGFQRWNYKSSEQLWSREGKQFDAKAFLSYCCEMSTRHGHILQARLRNHPSLVGLSGDGLSTIRVVTYRRPNGEIGVLLACLRMPTGASAVDNFEAGGIAAPIEPRTGVLGKAVAKDPRRGEFIRHPDSGASIEGFEVPYYAEAIDLTLKAHACFPWVPFVGWDVVITVDGAKLLEANPDWCVELAQIVMNKPLGETIYPKLYLEHIDDQARARNG